MQSASAHNRSLALIFITLLIDVIGLGIIIPVIPKLLSELGNYTVSEASAVGAWMTVAFALPQFIFSPVFGGLSDKYGRRPIIILSLMGLGIDFIIHAVAPTISILFIGRILAGICGASFTTATSYIADISTPEKRAQNFGLIGMAFGLGFILGPLIGGIVGNENVRMPFWVAASLSFINALLCLIALPESLKKEHRREFELKRANPFGTLKQLKKYPIVLRMMIPLFLLYIASHAVQTNWSFYTKYKFQWNERTIGFSLTVVGLMIAVVQGGLIRFIVPKIGNRKSIEYGFLLYALGMLLFAIADASWMMFVITIIYCLGGIAGPALQGEMSKAVPANAQGELSGGMTALMSISSVFGPLIMNSLFAVFSGKKAIFELPGAPMLLGSCLILISYVLVWRSYRLRESEVLQD